MSVLFENAKSKLRTLVGPAYEANPGRARLGPDDVSDAGAWWCWDREYEDEECLHYFHAPSNQFFGVSYDPVTNKVWIEARIYCQKLQELEVDFEALKMTVCDSTSTRSIDLQRRSTVVFEPLGFIATQPQTDPYILDLILEDISCKLLSSV